MLLPHIARRIVLCGTARKGVVIWYSTSQPIIFHFFSLLQALFIIASMGWFCSTACFGSRSCLLVVGLMCVRGGEDI